MSLDPKLTVRLEPALRWLTRFSNANLAVVGNKYDVEPGEIGAWLREYNGGTAAGLTEARILEVKEQTGGVTVTRINRGAPATASGEPSKRTDGGISPPRESGPDSVASTPEREAGASKHKRQNAARNAGGPSDRPWLRLKRVRVAPLSRMLTVVEAVLGGMPAIDAAEKHGAHIGSYYTFKNTFFGSGPVAREKVEAFRRFLGEHSAPTVPVETERKPASASATPKRKYARRSVAPPPVPVIPIGEDGWVRLEVSGTSRMNGADARYRPGAPAAIIISATALSRINPIVPAFKAGGTVFVEWHATRQLVRFIPDEDGHLHLRCERDGHTVAVKSEALGQLLGPEAFLLKIEQCEANAVVFRKEVA